MNDRPERLAPDNEQHPAANLPDAANEPQRPNRRELVERFAKAAMIAAPLVVFVSKAQAIHSKP